ncbi:hypothetical protein GALL_463390 [mine drainage metagenome]|uniref:Uncharacterized protein n=1 Tax=mine drainage metagenome TaxID=410659 RepID=A0A1J5PLK1_9ZZZZ
MRRVAKQLHAVLHPQHVKRGTGSSQPVARRLDAVQTNVGVNKAPPQIVRHPGGDPAAAKEIGDDHAGVAGRFDDAFEQYFRLLSWVVQSLARSCTNHVEFPYIINFAFKVLVVDQASTFVTHIHNP